ncbi:hypothetical protein [Gordonibacter sp.]|uniref:hypothetical protein n=1 Tax=Gordonibacter sp. TaxID=1968902 RepID=UPI002FCA054B
MERTTRKIVAYILHDPVANMEGYISSYDAAELQGAEDAGMIVLAEHNDGSRERVKASEVLEPQPEAKGVTLVQPRYVDERVRAVIDVFDAIAAGVAPVPLTLATNDATVTFAQALARLKEVVNGNA